MQNDLKSNQAVLQLLSRSMTDVDVSLDVWPSLNIWVKTGRTVSGFLRRMSGALRWTSQMGETVTQDIEVCGACLLLWDCFWSDGLSGI